MKLLLAQNKVAGVAAAWRRQYPDGKDTLRGSSQTIFERLEAAGPGIAPAQAAEIIGNKSWSHYSCGECGEYFDRVVEIQDPDTTVYLCAGCARAVAALASVVLP